MLGNLESDLKKVLLAGIGALATTVEKSNDSVDALVNKGEQTLQKLKKHWLNWKKNKKTVIVNPNHLQYEVIPCVCDVKHRGFLIH